MYLKSEEDFLPWERVISSVSYIISMFEDDRELYPMIEVTLMLLVYHKCKCLVDWGGF
jgi:hypothetical protein